MWIVHYALMTYSRPSVAPILLGITHPDVIYQAKADDDDDGEKYRSQNVQRTFQKIHINVKEQIRKGTEGRLTSSTKGN